MATERYLCECRNRQDSVLTFDGGGMRGYASLIYMRRLMEKCREYEREADALEDHDEGDDDMPLPCHYFKYIAGTSTGGLIAIMLARLRMPVDSALKAYHALGGTIFGHKRRMGMAWSRYDHESLERAVRDVVRDHCRDAKKSRYGDDDIRDPEANEPCCRTVCYAVRRDERKDDQVYLFRSYFHPSRDSRGAGPTQATRGRNAGDNQQHFIWQAARATTAAPSYFKPIVLESIPYMDGGVQVNNPSWETWNEVEAMYGTLCTDECEGGRNAHHRHCQAKSGGVGVMVSIGTGIGAPLTMFSRGNVVRRFMKVFKKAKRAMTDTERMHEYTETRATNAQVGYFRFNVRNGLENFKMDACNVVDKQNLALNEIRDITEAYIDGDDEVKQAIRDCARQLVTMRRERCAEGHGRRFRGYCAPGPLKNRIRRQRKTVDDILSDHFDGPHQAAAEPIGSQRLTRRSTQPQDPNQNGRPTGGRVIHPGTWPRTNPTAQSVVHRSQRADHIHAPEVARYQQGYADDPEIARYQHGGFNDPEVVRNRGDAPDDPEVVMSPRSDGPIELPHERDPLEADEGTPRARRA